MVFDKEFQLFVVLLAKALLVVLLGVRNSQTVLPLPDEPALFVKHFKFCLSSAMFVSLTIIQTSARQTFNACDKPFKEICLKSLKKALPSKMCLSSNVCRGSQTHKLTQKLLDKQNSRCLSSNAGSFGRGLSLISI